MTSYRGGTSKIAIFYGEIFFLVKVRRLSRTNTWNTLYYTRSEVGKVRPGEVFCPARGVVNSIQTSYFSCKNSNLRSC